MRVLVVCDWFLKYASPQAAALRDLGVDAALLCRDHAQEFGGAADEVEKTLGAVHAAGVSVFQLPGRVSSAKDLPTVVRTLATVCRWAPDVVHAHDNHDPRLLLAAGGYRVALTIHDPSPHPGAPRLPAAKRAIRAAWLRRAQRLVVHSDSLKKELAAADLTRVWVMPLGVEPAATPLRRPPERCVLFFGRLQTYKGLPVLLAAMRLVWSHRPDVRLLVLGEGPEAARLPADERIERSIGYVPESAIEPMLRRASLVVLPYTQASQSAVGLLALARGVPAVVSDVGALPDLALDRSFVVPPENPRELAAAIVRHLDHSASVREAALQRAQHQFSWRVVAERSVELYNEMLAEAR
jgi:glycosyltransferase involved in cell wall biosynthesis